MRLKGRISLMHESSTKIGTQNKMLSESREQATKKIRKEGKKFSMVQAVVGVAGS